MPRGGKRVSEGVAARRLCHPRGHHGPANLLLNDRAIEVVAPLLPTAFPNPAPVIHPTRTAPAAQAAAGSGAGPRRLPALLVQPLQAVCLRVNKDADGAGNAYGNPP